MNQLTLQQIYQQKLCNADKAAELIKNGDKVAIPVAAGQPPAILQALAERAKANEIRDVRFYYLLCTSIAGNTIFDKEVIDKLIPMSYFHNSVERAIDKFNHSTGLPMVDFIPCHFSQVPRSMVEHVGVDTLVATVSPMDAEGNFSLATNADYSLAVALKEGSRVILEVNSHMPYVKGNCLIPLSKVSAIVENDLPLPQLPPAPRTDVDDAIGKIIAGLVKDGDCIQMGIGALPDAVCVGLKNHKNLGVQTEMMTSGLAQLMRDGVINNSQKTLNKGKSVYTFALGDQKLYDFLDNNPTVEAHPVDYTNNPFVISQNDNVVSVNATMQIDLTGACNSEFMNGRQFSGTGGQLDFVRGAYASKGGRSIIACHSTAANGTVSRITPRLTGPTTTPRNETHIVVTEYGWVDLKGKSISERMQALISIAHPKFREELTKAAHDTGLFKACAKVTG